MAFVRGDCSASGPGHDPTTRTPRGRRSNCRPTRLGRLGRAPAKPAQRAYARTDRRSPNFTARSSCCQARRRRRTPTASRELVQPAVQGDPAVPPRKSLRRQQQLIAGAGDLPSTSRTEPSECPSDTNHPRAEAVSARGPREASNSTQARSTSTCMPARPRTLLSAAVCGSTRKRLHRLREISDRAPRAEPSWTWNAKVHPRSSSQSPTRSASSVREQRGRGAESRSPATPSSPARNERRYQAATGECAP